MARYVVAAAFAEASEALRLDPAARLIAGGTDLMVGIRNGRLITPEAFVSVHAVAEGRELVVAKDGSNLRIGSLATHGLVVSSSEIKSGWTALSDASALVGSPATRNVGTVGGNIMNASPAMELGSPLLVFNAEVELVSAEGTRRLPLQDLLVGPGRTSAEAHEVLAAVVVPAAPERSGSAYVRLQYRRAMEIAVVGAAATLTIATDGRIEEGRLALTAVAPTCLRVPSAERLLARAPLSAKTIAAAAAAAASVGSPIDDVRGSAEYRRRMIPVIARRALTVAARRARGESIDVPSIAPTASWTL